ncbi:MAG: hypothetical protein M3507_08470 [Actinomycetota bacterium]|nr:hypothetical protein [Actinomycetota bacterium]
MSESRTRTERTPKDYWLLESLGRQAGIMAGMVGVARAGAARTPADTSVAEALAWVGVQRQAGRFGRNLQARTRGRLAERWQDELESHGRLLERCREQAGQALARLDPAVVAQAQARLGLRVAVVGKGGAGKSMISGTLARLLARRGRHVLAADLDTNPGLAFSLGVPPTAGGLPAEAVEEHAGAAYGWRLRSGLSPADAVERFTLTAPDGARFLPLGKIDTVDKQGPKRTLVALLEILLGFGDPGWDMVGDLEAGPTTPFERYHAFADRAIVVVGPAWRSAMTARRLLPLVADVPTIVVANRFRDEPDHPGLAPTVRIPFDAEVADAERRGLAPIDVCPDSPTIAAIAHLADVLTRQHGGKAHAHDHQEVPL